MSDIRRRAGRERQVSEPLEQVFEAARRWGLDPATLDAARALTGPGLRENATQTERDLPPDHPARSSWGQAALDEIDRLRALAGPREREDKRAPCVHGNPCREAQCVEYGRWDDHAAREGVPESDLRDAVETIRVALKGARGLALDSDETALDFELGNAIDILDRLSLGEGSDK